MAKCKIILWNPKFAPNVGGVLRALSCLDGDELLWTGKRVSLDVAAGQRLPREERMKGYRDVAMRRSDKPFDFLPDGAVPVAVEVRDNAERLFDFEHPENPVYVFGPEDGSLPSSVLRHCHRFVVIPAAHCLNLAASASVVLYDRKLKRYRDGLDDLVVPGDFEDRGPIDNVDAFVGVSPAGLGKIRK